MHRTLQSHTPVAISAIPTILSPLAVPQKFAGVTPSAAVARPTHAICCSIHSTHPTALLSLLLSRLLRRVSPITRDILIEPVAPSVTRHPDIAMENNAIFYHVDVSLQSPLRCNDQSCRGCNRRGVEDRQYSGAEGANVILFVLESTGHLEKTADDVLRTITLELVADILTRH